MKFLCAYTNEAGVTVSLAVSASSAALQSDLGADEPPSAAEDLARSAFFQTLPEWSKLLEPTAAQVDLALQQSYVNTLQKLMDENQAALPQDCTGAGDFKSREA